MPKDPVAPLIVANEKEKEKSWEDLETPSKLAAWFAKVFAVDLGVFKKEFNVFVGPDEPKGGDRGKVHFKTSRPIAVGFQVQGKYNYIYQYPVNVPVQVDKDNIPVGLTQLTAGELTDYGQTNTDLYVWAILRVT